MHILFTLGDLLLPVNEIGAAATRKSRAIATLCVAVAPDGDEPMKATPHRGLLMRHGQNSIACAQCPEGMAQMFRDT